MRAARVAAVLAATFAGLLLLGRGSLLDTTPERVIETGPSEQRWVALADGSRALLAPESSLRVPTSFRSSGQPIALDGQAYFVVAADPERHFRVAVPGGVVEVLGTAFVVRTALQTAEVAVREGRVSLRGVGATPSEGLLLSAGQAASVSRSGRVQPRTGAFADSELAWTGGRVVLEARPVSEVLAELERWYGVSVEVPVDDASRRLNVSFAATGDDVREVVAGIAFSLGLELVEDPQSGTLALTGPSGR